MKSSPTFRLADTIRNRLSIPRSKNSLVCLSSTAFALARHVAESAQPAAFLSTELKLTLMEGLQPLSLCPGDAAR